MSRHYVRPRPIGRIKVKLTLEADAESMKSTSERLAGSRVSGGVLSATLADTPDPLQAFSEVKAAEDAIREVFGQSRKEFK